MKTDSQRKSGMYCLCVVWAMTAFVIRASADGLTTNEVHVEFSLDVGSNAVANGLGSVAVGTNTLAAGTASFVGGANATATHDRVFIWSDEFGVTNSGASDQFIVWAENGIYLLGGVVYADDGSEISNLDGSAIATGSVGSDQIAGGAITSAKLAASAVGTTQIADDAVTSAKLAHSIRVVSTLAIGNALVTGNSSLALGSTSSTKAGGIGSLAHGNTAMATGNYSYSGGNSVFAIGASSHAEGYANQAVGIASHAEGSVADAFGNSSHAEGYATEAIGNESHAAGAWARASYNNSYVWSDGSAAPGYTTSTATKQYTIQADNGIRLLGGPTEVESRFAVGSSTASAQNSAAIGNSTTASGIDSFAAGNNATASNNNSFVWSDGTAVSSSSNQQFTVHASNGIRLLGGPVEILKYGDISMGSFTNGLPQ